MHNVNTNNSNIDINSFGHRLITHFIISTIIIIAILIINSTVSPSLVFLADDCDKEGTACSNGVCLGSVCHCNDGFGGCNCQVPGKWWCEKH